MKPDQRARIAGFIVTAIILVAGVLYAVSVLVGPVGGLLRQVFPARHLEA